MLCIPRLSLTCKRFGFTFLRSPAGRCLCGALPIAGARAPSPPPPPIPPSLPLPPACHSAPISPIPTSPPPCHSRAHTQRVWQAGFRRLPTPAARRLAGSPPLPAGSPARRLPKTAVARPADVRRGGTWNYGSCPIRPSLWVGIPESPTESRSETGRRESPLEFCGGLQPARGGRGLGEGSVSPPVVRSFCGDSYFHVYSTSACAESFAEEWCIKKPTKHQERFCQILKREASKRPLAVNLRLFTVTMHCNVVQTSDSEITRVLINGSIRGDWSGGKKPSHVTQKVSFSTRDFRSLN